MTEAAAEKTEDAFRDGSLVAGRFRIDRRLGAGTSGAVFRATEISSGAPVALKVVHRELCGDRQIFGRYKREAKILQRLEGRRVVRFLDFFEFEGLLVIALQYVEGDSLEIVQRRGLTVDQSIQIALQLCEGLEDAHAIGVVHRDLKPANVMIEPAGYPVSEGELSISILDFGLAKVVHGEHMTTGLTEHDMIFGTPEYMAPEQARGDEVDGRCDVYALGVILYELLSGSVPFMRKTPLATMTAHLTEAVPPITKPGKPAIPAELTQVVMRALEKEPPARYASIRELGRAIVDARGATSVRVGADSDELGETELSIRLSQVVPERRGRFSSQPPQTLPVRESDPASAISQRLTPAHPEAESSQRGFWVITIAIAIGCAVIGAWLAMR
jgi:eukaryotic-like serine/threonine-protein kinase